MLRGKTAYVYQRISTEGQSFWSMSGQKDANTSFCAREGVEVLGSFDDDGESGKTFERPGWRQLERAFRVKPADLIIVSAYDRFSRSLSKALTMIEAFEGRHNCYIISSSQYMALPLNGTDYFLIRANILAAAEAECRRLSDRTSTGTKRALQAGANTNRRILGYQKTRNEQGRSILVPDSKEFPLIQLAGRLFIQGRTIAQIKKELASFGLKIKGNSSIQNLFEDRRYAGWQYAPAVDDKPAQWVRCLHEPAFSASEWEGIQQAKNPQKRIRCIESDHVPHRGQICCPECLHSLTGGPSKGRNNLYYYYRCTECNGQNYSAIRAHQQIVEIFSRLSFPQELVKKIKKAATIILSRGDKERVSDLKAAHIKAAEIRERIGKLEYDFIAGEKKIPQRVFDTWHKNWSEELVELEDRISALSDETVLKVQMQALEDMLPSLMNMATLYESANTSQKRELFRFVMGEDVEKTKIGYRTAYLNPIFTFNSLNFSILEIKESRSIDQKTGDTPARSPYGNWIEPLSRLALIFRAA